MGFQVWRYGTLILCAFGFLAIAPIAFADSVELVPAGKTISSANGNKVTIVGTSNTIDTHESKGEQPLSKEWLISLLVTAVATILGAVAAEYYKDAKARVFPGEVFGPYVLLSPDDEVEQQVQASALKIKSHGYELWGNESVGRKSRVYSGYINMGYIVFSYRSKDPQGIGFGEYFLEPKDGEKAEFVGYMIGNFCGHMGQQPNRRIMQCNVVMVRGELGGTEEINARITYRDYLSKPCVLNSEARRVPLEKCATPSL